MSEFSQGLEQALSQRAGKILQVLEEWIRCNSYSANISGVNRQGELLDQAFGDIGMSSQRFAGKEVGDHFLWTSSAWHDKPEERTVFVGHHDTVFPPDSFDEFTLEGDMLRGPGVLDMKGGLAIVHATLAAFADAGMLSDTPVALLCVGDEEIGSPESQDLIRRLCQGARCALVFEAGRAEDKIITRRKGTGAIKVTAHGKAAHAGNHHKEGVNAIWSLARFIDLAQKETNYEAGITVNVGKISGGEARNTVPHTAGCEVDIRFLEAVHGEALVERLQAHAASIQEETGCSFDLDGGVRRLPLERTEASVDLCRRYGLAAQAAGLGSQEADLIGGGSDASTTHSAGVPSIDGMGPRGKGFHTHQEFIEVSSLPLKVEALGRFLFAEYSQRK